MDFPVILVDAYRSILDRDNGWARCVFHENSLSK